MTGRPDAMRVQQFLVRTLRRISLLAAVNGAAIGAAGGIALLVLVWLSHWPAAVGYGGSVGLIALSTIGFWWSGRRREMTPREVERRAPECRHVLVTAAELLEDPARAHPYITAAVCRDASRVVAQIDVARLFPAGRAVGWLALALLGWAATAAVVAARPAPTLTNLGIGHSNDHGPAIAGVQVVVTPPDYAGQPAATLRDPARVDVLAGSRLHVIASTGDATAVMLETIGGRLALSADGHGAFVGDISADGDGYLAFQPTGADGREGVRRLVGLGVIPDHPPIVRLTKPGKDLFISDARRTLSVAVEAHDDLALASLRLTYTKVSGSGEDFKFADGDVPLRLTKSDGRAWTGEVEWNLADLKLEPGDMIVYRGVASDARPGATPVESDAFIVEILSPGAMAAEGFAIDDDRDRYALSQRMIIIKTERLVAKRASLTAEAFNDEASGIAAEQRQVRAVFVFMLGGELADDPGAAGQLNEVVEAQGESELLAGRMQNKGRGDLLVAIRHMSEASSALAVPNTGTALTAEHAALDALQSAFTKSRYILRALTERESLDLSRRLTGKLTGIVRAPRVPPLPEPDPRLAGLRRALAGVAGLAGRSAYTPDNARETTAVAQAVLRADPAATALQAVVSALGDAAAAMTRGAAGDARTSLDRTATALSAAIRDQLQDAPATPAGPDTARLGGALSDALRRLGGS